MDTVTAAPLGQAQKPIYDTCEFCRLPIRPGEAHGIIVANEQGDPELRCRIRRLELAESEIPGTLTGSALAHRSQTPFNDAVNSSPPGSCPVCFGAHTYAEHTAALAGRSR